MNFRRTKILPFILGMMSVIMATLFVFISVRPVDAQSAASSQVSPECNITDVKKAIRLSIYIPGVTVMLADETGTKHPYVQSMACFIADIYRYLAGVAGILAVVMMIYGGIKYTVSFGNPSTLQDARDTVSSAMIGLALVLGTYVILNFINPALTSLKVPYLSDIKGELFVWPNGSYWCEDQVSGSYTAADTNQTSCGSLGVSSDGKNCYYRNGCDVDNGQICVLNEDTNKASCQSAQDFCLNATDCAKADTQIQTAGILNKGCAKPYYATGQQCVYETLLSCANPEWVEVQCDTGATLFKSTPCWTEDRPASKGVFYCKDSRPIFKADSICCAQVEQDVDCRQTCNDDEIEAPNCQIKNVDGGIHDLRKPDGGDDSCTDAELANNWKCCVQLKLDNYPQ